MSLVFFISGSKWTLWQPAGGFHPINARPSLDSFQTRGLLSELRVNDGNLRQLRRYLTEDLGWNRVEGHNDFEVIDLVVEALLRGTLSFEIDKARRGHAMAKAVIEKEEPEVWQELEMPPEPPEEDTVYRISEAEAQALAAMNRDMHEQGLALHAHCSQGECSVCEAQQKVLVD